MSLSYLCVSLPAWAVTRVRGTFQSICKQRDNSIGSAVTVYKFDSLSSIFNVLIYQQFFVNLYIVFFPSRLVVALPLPLCIKAGSKSRSWMHTLCNWFFFSLLIFMLCLFLFCLNISKYVLCWMLFCSFSKLTNSGSLNFLYWLDWNVPLILVTVHAGRETQRFFPK